MRKFLLCKVLRWHKWAWLLSSVKTTSEGLDAIPPHAKCKRCGLVYSKRRISVEVSYEHRDNIL